MLIFHTTIYNDNNSLVFFLNHTLTMNMKVEGKMSARLLIRQCHFNACTQIKTQLNYGMSAVYVCLYKLISSAYKESHRLYRRMKS